MSSPRALMAQALAAREGITPISLDPRLRFRVWVAGSLVEDVWVNVLDPADWAHLLQARERHLGAAERAEAAGQVWLIEIYDPSLPEEAAYLRFGTDREGMTNPQEE